MHIAAVFFIRLYLPQGLMGFPCLGFCLPTDSALCTLFYTPGRYSPYANDHTFGN